MIVACVRTGVKYPVEYVDRLRAGVARHLKEPHRFVCLTDRPDELSGIETQRVSWDLPGWWMKMALFAPGWASDQKVIYLDLDMAVVGDLSPLAYLESKDLAICENFTRAAGNLAWPCRYSSCAMVLPPQRRFLSLVWKTFIENRYTIMESCGIYGDQKAIEELVPGRVVFLQRVLPPGFFLGYRDLPKHKTPPKGCSVVVFAGNSKPHNTNCAWAKAAWAA